MNPVPATVTALPFCKPVLGVTVIVGPAAEALITPKDAKTPRTRAPAAMLVINRFIVYVLPIAVVTISPKKSPC
jgi:hypothetical protein